MASCNLNNENKSSMLKILDDRKNKLLAISSLLALGGCATSKSESDESDDGYVAPSASMITPISNNNLPANVSASASRIDADNTDAEAGADETGSGTNDAPTDTVVITDIPTEDQTLTATGNQGGGVDLGTNNYALGEDDIGAEITAEANQTDGQNTPVSETSIATVSVASLDDIAAATMTNVADIVGVDGTDSILTIDGATLKSHSISDGKISFDDADIFTDSLQISTQSDIAAALEYLQAQDLGDAGSTVSFDVGVNTIVFIQGDDAGTDNLDVAVLLEASPADNLLTTNGSGEQDLSIL